LSVYLLRIYPLNVDQAQHFNTENAYLLGVKCRSNTQSDAKTETRFTTTNATFTHKFVTNKQSTIFSG